MDRREFVRTGMGVVVMNAFGRKSARDGVPSGLPLLSVDESAQLGEKLGIDRVFATSNVFRALLHSQSATAGFYGVVNALLFHNKVAARTRELIILRIGWRTGSEYVFCNHVRFCRDLGIPDEDVLGVGDPERCRAYSRIDRAVIQLADELHEHAEVTRSTWAVLENAFASDELVELLLTAGFWRMAAGFVKSAKIPLDKGVLSWPEGRKPPNAS